MKNLKLLKKEINLSKETNTHLQVFSEDAFVKCKMGSINDFYNLLCVEDMAYQVFDELNDTTLQSITFDVIDDEYFEYLKKHNLQDTQNTRNEYCNSLNEETRNKLWKINGYNEGYDWGIIPVILENPTYTTKFNEEPNDITCEYKLSDETIKKIKSTLVKTFEKCKNENINYQLNDDSFYISPHLLNVEHFNDDLLVDILFDEGVRTLHGETIKESQVLSIQEMDKDAPIDFFGIFVLYKYDVPSVITKEYIDNAKETTINYPTLDVDTIESVMEKDLDITFELLTLNIVYPEYVDAAIEEFKKYCIEKFTEKAQTLETMNEKIAGHCKVNDKKTKKKK